MKKGSLGRYWSVVEWVGGCTDGGTGWGSSVTGGWLICSRMGWRVYTEALPKPVSLPKLVTLDKCRLFSGLSSGCSRRWVCRILLRSWPRRPRLRLTLRPRHRRTRCKVPKAARRPVEPLGRGRRIQEPDFDPAMKQYRKISSDLPQIDPFLLTLMSFVSLQSTIGWARILA